MALTKVTTGIIADSAVTTTQIDDATITSTDMAVDPRNASNLNSGDVPLAQLGNAPATDTTGIRDDIALLAFKTQANGNLAKYNLVDQFVDSFEDASGVDASASTNEVRDGTGKYYSGSGAPPSGGTETIYSTYTSHTFTASGNFVVNLSGNVDYFMVAGGGAGGGGPIAGGGGAGGYLTGTSLAVTAQSYAVVVGAGGIFNNGSGDNSVSKNGLDSTFAGLTAIGGGGGGNGSGGVAASGGSGGGAHGYNQSFGSGTAGPPRQGYDGARNSSPSYGAGGGGGAGAAGVQPPQGHGGPGGVGIQNDYKTGSNIYYAGGGGGARWNAGSGGTGGNGGGGDGQTVSGSTNATAGTDGLGGGGGGGDYAPAVPNGGSGIVIIRYTTGDLSEFLDMTLVSNAQTAQAQPTKGDLVLTYTNAAGTATINTDLIASVSRDNGTTYTAATLALQGTTGGHTILTANDIDISGQPAGTSMRYKIATANQGVAKQTRIQAVSLGWS